MGPDNSVTEISRNSMLSYKPIQTTTITTRVHPIMRSFRRLVVVAVAVAVAPHLRGISAALFDSGAREKIKTFTCAHPHKFRGLWARVRLLRYRLVCIYETCSFASCVFSSEYSLVFTRTRLCERAPLRCGCRKLAWWRRVTTSC